MNLQFYFEKLHASKEFQDFAKQHKDAYFCSGFFIIDKESQKIPDDKQHLDFYSPDDKQTWSFQLEDNSRLVPIEQIDKRTPEKIPDNLDFNFDYAEKKIIGEMFENKITNKIQKIIWSLQRLDSKDFLIGTIFISGMGLIKIKINLPDMEVVEFEKKNFMDFLKRE